MRCLQRVSHFLNHASRRWFISNSLFSKCLDFSAAARSSENLTKSFIRISKLLKTHLALFMISWSTLMILLLFDVWSDWWLSESENRQALRMKISDCVSDSRSRAQNKGRGGEIRSGQRVWTWISRAGYYQRGITIFAIRQYNKNTFTIFLSFLPNRQNQITKNHVKCSVQLTFTDTFLVRTSKAAFKLS